eukprot:gene3875-15172_t
MDEETIKKIISNAVSSLVINDHMDALMEKLESNIEAMIDKKIAQATEPLRKEISILEGKIEVFQAKLSELYEVRLDDADQYSRRSCLRVFGVPLPANGKEPKNDC